jgi:hypothetical protein
VLRLQLYNILLLLCCHPVVAANAVLVQHKFRTAVAWLIQIHPSRKDTASHMWLRRWIKRFQLCGLRVVCARR